MILGIDPGTYRSGWVLVEGIDSQGLPDPVLFAEENNEMLLGRIRMMPAHWLVAIEDIGHQSNSVGKDVFETVRWTGRMQEAAGADRTLFLGRHEIIIHHCGRRFRDVHGKRKGNGDVEVRQSIIDQYGGDEVAIGGKKCQNCKGKGWKGAGRPTCPQCGGDGWFIPPGPLHGISKHVWQALAVALLAHRRITDRESGLRDLEAVWEKWQESLFKASA